MKRIIFSMLVMGLAVSAFAQVQLPQPQYASGKWAVENGRYYQNDENAPLAKANIQVPQRGSMLFDFNVRYESGAEDGHGGFGVHLFVDRAYNGPSWGSGNSYLLWLNYDEKPVDSRIPAGLSAQVYRSYSNTRMDLVQSIDLNQYMNQLVNSLDIPISFRIWVNGDSGEIRVYDPSAPSVYYTFTVDKKDIPLHGDWIAVRTNSIKLSFAPGLAPAFGM
ncbi:MAG: hypothetical protein LBS86_02330 [Treponema sp.]|jgi:hypothetical protein|nr:hypothetical protein [Treponema sp.]